MIDNNNRYELQEEIARGGQGIVYKCYDHDLRRTVAIKVIHNSFASDRMLLSALESEARVSADFDHTNITTILDVSFNTSTPYIVMQYVATSLDRQLQKAGRIDETEALKIGMQICSALDYAHQRGIVHRDIKPHNILLTENMEVKVTDFGLARAIQSSTTVVEPLSVAGSPQYMAPERWKENIGDTRSDLYSLGAVLFEMVTGTAPYVGKSFGELYVQHTQHPVPLIPRDLNVSEEYQYVIHKAMAKDPTDRFSSASEMEDILRLILNGHYIPDVSMDLYDLHSEPKVPETSYTENVQTDTPNPMDSSDSSYQIKLKTIWNIFGMCLTSLIMISLLALSIFYSTSLTTSSDPMNDLTELGTRFQVESQNTDDQTTGMSPAEGASVQPEAEPGVADETINTNNLPISVTPKAQKESNPVYISKALLQELNHWHMAYFPREGFDDIRKKLEDLETIYEDKLNLSREPMQSFLVSYNWAHNVEHMAHNNFLLGSMDLMVLSNSDDLIVKPNECLLADDLDALLLENDVDEVKDDIVQVASECLTHTTSRYLMETIRAIAEITWLIDGQPPIQSSSTFPIEKRLLLSLSDWHEKWESSELLPYEQTDLLEELDIIMYDIQSMVDPESLFSEQIFAYQLSHDLSFELREDIAYRSAMLLKEAGFDPLSDDFPRKPCELPTLSNKHDSEVNLINMMCITANVADSLLESERRTAKLTWLSTINTVK